MKRTLFTLFFLVITVAGTIPLDAQTTSIHSTGLILPNKIITAGEHSLLVCETGTFTPNTGRISIVDRSSGNRKTLVDGLPSGVNDLGGVPTPNGPSGLVLHGHKLYISISSGDAVLSAGGPGLELPNPNPSSQLFDSVLEMVLPGNYEEITDGFHLTLQNQQTLTEGGVVTLENSEGQKMTVRSIANLPDSVPEPVEGALNNVRASNLYGLEFFKKNLYIVDASLNLLYKVRISDGHYSVFADFPPIAIPDGPIVEAVPDNVHRVGNNLLVAMLTGFPFPQQGAEIRKVSLKNARQETSIGELTSAIDVLHVKADGSYFTLEFSTDFLAGAPGRLRFYSSPDAAPRDLVLDLITPTSMTRDEATGDLFVTNIFPGFITRITDLP
jgi:hypothetical protein